MPRYRATRRHLSEYTFEEIAREYNARVVQMLSDPAEYFETSPLNPVTVVPEKRAADDLVEKDRC